MGVSDRDTGQRGHIAPRHVWVRFAPGSHHPGVLLDWRKVGSRWEAYVVWADGGGNIRTRAHAEWVRQEHVLPADR